MTSSKIFLWLCLSFISGVFLRSFIFIPQHFLLVFLILGIIFISLFWHHKKAVVFGLSILVLALGIWRYGAKESIAKESLLKRVSAMGQEAVLIGPISKEPDIRESCQNLVISPEVVELAGRHYFLSKTEKVLIRAPKYPQYRYGERLRVEGKLSFAQNFGGFDYKGYLEKQGIFSLLEWPKIELIKGQENKGFFSLFYGKVLSLKEKIRQGIYQNFSPPQDLILGALLLGDKRKIYPEIKEQLNRSGLRHISAVSGLHIVILANIFALFFLLLGFSKKASFYLTFFFLFFFIAMIGFQASAVRAGIMTGSYLLAELLGRRSASKRTIVFAAAFILAQNPFLLRFDIGFQLSFLATLGIIFFGPFFQKKLEIIPSKYIRDILAMTFSAYLFTLPLLMYNFGQFSLVSPLANLLVVPVIPFVMSLGFIFAFLALFLPFLAWPLSLFLWVFLSYIVLVVKLFSSFSFSSFSLQISWFWLLPFYFSILLFAFYLQKRQRLGFLQTSF